MFDDLSERDLEGDGVDRPVAAVAFGRLLDQYRRDWNDAFFAVRLVPTTGLWWTSAPAKPVAGPYLRYERQECRYPKSLPVPEACQAGCRYGMAPTNGATPPSKAPLA